MKHLTSYTVLIALSLVLAGCGGSNMTSFIHEEYNFGFIERVAIVPFENLSDDQGAGARATNIFLSELLASRTFDVVEPGEVSRALAKHNLTRTASLTTAQATALGSELKVQAVFLGTVNESADYRSGGTSTAKVNITARMVECERGETIWSATATAGGRGVWSTLFGGGDQAKSEVTRDCIRTLLGSLFE
ncbi:MAG: hypothetical protein Kow0074_03040 [Candidatus Zixiibacteriota bacterium]